ncbi:MAG: hypothetical protein QS748_05730 [Candidatus Endonucleobacter bathymodioli]|uniref:Uncharacterized protein n=1 Tax=Candidatus Endonucleibacter bathymodioli TaxID=539814 RepID=A0AA90NXS8_9GAMM|nr:hypothetical protein [Candidatus Endonucleobacter bathymodioli]
MKLWITLEPEYFQKSVPLDAYTLAFKDLNIDGKGCLNDNIFVELLCLSVKCACVYQKKLNNTLKLKQKLKGYVQLYNYEHPPEGLDNNTSGQTLINWGLCT